MKQPWTLKKRYLECVQDLSHIVPFHLAAITSYLCLLSRKQVRAHVLLQKERNSVLSTKTDDTRTLAKNTEKARTFQPFINEHVLADVTSVSIPLCFAIFLMYNPFQNSDILNLSSRSSSLVHLRSFSIQY